MRKGILLAGGMGTRLYPLTKIMSKHLLPVYDKPMFYYSLSHIMLSGIKDILVISTERDLKFYQEILLDGSQFGVSIHYEVQKDPGGIPEGILIAENFLSGADICLALGDNIFVGNGFQHIMSEANNSEKGTIFAKPVPDPERFGILKMKGDQPLEVIEKPSEYVGNLAVVGMYFLPKVSVEIAKGLKKSKRGELEIADLLNELLGEGLLKVETLSRGIAWFDAGTPKALIEVSNFIQSLENKQMQKIGCLEEIAWRMGYISRSEFEELRNDAPTSFYKKYLEQCNE
jgi:glucose-1-phosphate thymidylyltransferase